MDERLAEVFLAVFRVPLTHFGDSLSPDTVKGWDSLGHLALVQALEAAFDLQLGDEEVAALDSVARIKEVLRARGVT